MDSDRRKPGVIDTAVTTWGSKSGAMLSARPLIASLTVCVSGLPPADSVSPSLTSTIRPWRARIISGAACFEVMIVRQYALPKDRFSVFKVRLPERSPLMHHRFLAGDTIDEHIEATLLLVDTLEERLYLRFQGVIDPDGNRMTSGRRDHVNRLFDCF